VQEAPLEVSVHDAAPLDVVTLPDVRLAEDQTLDVRIVEAAAVPPQEGTSFVVPDMNGIDVAEPFQSQAIDVDGYRQVSVFVTYDALVSNGASATFDLDAACLGKFVPTDVSKALPAGFPSDGFDSPGFVLTAPVVGPELRLRIAMTKFQNQFPEITGLVVTVWLTR